MNYWIACGRISRDITVSESGKQAFSTLAVPRPYPWNKNSDGEEVTDFHEIIFRGEKSASRASAYLTKGVKILVRAIACRDSWKADGEWKNRNFFIVEDWEYAESKGASNGGGSSSQSSGGSSQNSAPKRSFMDIDDTSDDDGIPFQ